MLYGMAEPMHAAMRRLGLRLRVYAPVGELVPGMAYLVRRLLENTSNESFVRHRFAEGRDLDELLAPPDVDELPAATRPEARAAHRSRATRRPTSPSPCPSGAGPRPAPPWPPPWPRSTAELGRNGPRADRRRAGPDRGHHRLGRPVRSRPWSSPAPPPAGSPRPTPRWARPSRRPRRGAARPRSSGPPCCSGRPTGCGRRRHDIAALECFEAGKPWDQADADVCEAIDFCEYYGREMLRLDRAAADLVQSPPGEANRLSYQGKGVTAVIAPWNFPLAIPTGMTVAALVGRQPGDPQARRADPGRRVTPGRGPGRGRCSARRDSVPARRRRGRGRPSGRAPRRGGDRVHRVEGRGAGHQPAGRRHRAGPAPREAGHRRDGWQERPRSSTPTPTPTRPCRARSSRRSGTRGRSARPPAG